MALKPLHKPSSLFARLIGHMKATFGGLILFSTLLIVNIIQSLTFIVRPIAPQICRKLNRNVASSWWALCVFTGRHYSGSHIKICGDDVPNKENAIVILNHQSMADVPVLLDFALKKNSIGNIKCFVKSSLQKVPGMGWGMTMLDFPFVKRNWDQDQARIKKIFQIFIDFNIPIWMLSFSEGTRLTAKKLKRSQDFAKKNNLKPTQNVMIPRVKGFVATVSQLRNHVDAVYDLTIGYQDGVPSLWQWASGHALPVTLYVKRFPIQNIPESETEISQWLFDLFYAKDEWLETFYQSQKN